MNEITIRALPCGSIRLPASMAFRKAPHPLRRIALPVNAFLIEHPLHGRILVDTGLSADCRQLLPPPLLRFYDPQIAPGETVTERLAALGLRPEDIDLLLLTHNDIDHTCALPALAGSVRRILMPEEEYYWSCRAVYQMRQVRSTWEPYLGRIELPCYYGSALGPVGRGYDVFGDDSVLLVSCPGHTAGLACVMVNQSPSWRFRYQGSGSCGGRFAILASDAAFSHRNIDELVEPGYGFEPVRQRRALQWLQKMKADESCVSILCSHDPAASGIVVRF